MTYKSVVSFCTLFALLSLSANALDFKYSLFHEGEYSDNIDNTPNNAHKEFTSRIGTDLNLISEPSNRYQFQGNYTFAYVDYLYSSSDNELEASGNLFASYEIIDNILSWDVNHTQDYLIVDRTGADTPENTERRSTLTTGPTLNLFINPTGVDQLAFNTKYAATEFENTTEANSERKIGSVTWRHLVNPLTSFSLSTEYSDVTFDDKTNDYEYFRHSLSVDRRLKQGNINLGVGVNEVKRKEDDQLSGGNEEDSGYFMNALLRNQWGKHLLNFNLRRELTDNSFGLGVAGSNSGESTDGNSIVQDIVERRTIGTDYTYTFNIDTLSLQLSWNDEDYQIEPADQSTMLLAITYNLNMSNRSSWRLTGRTNVTDFKEDDNIDRDIVFGGGADYSYLLTKNLSLTLGINYEERVSYLQPGSASSPRNYKETTAAFSIRYSPL